MNSNVYAQIIFRLQFQGACLSNIMKITCLQLDGAQDGEVLIHGISNWNLENQWNQIYPVDMNALYFLHVFTQVALSTVVGIA